MNAMVQEIEKSDQTATNPISNHAYQNNFRVTQVIQSFIKACYDICYFDIYQTLKVPAFRC